MTIASEISRLQTAKADMKTAIVNKGVSVADSVSLSNYCDCINAISSGGSIVEVLVVGGGGAGTCRFGGGGGGGVVKTLLPISGGSATITVGAGGVSRGCAGCQSKIVSGDNSVCATGGTAGGWEFGGNSGEGYINSSIVQAQNNGGTGCCDSRGSEYVGGGGGGGAGGAGCSATTYGCGVDGGAGLYGYGGGGGGGSGACLSRGVGVGIDGGGTGENRCSKRSSCNANNYGGGGGGYGIWTACGCQGVVDVCYSLYGLSGFTSATGGNCCYTCNGMYVHRFTSNGTFTILS